MKSQLSAVAVVLAVFFTTSVVARASIVVEVGDDIRLHDGIGSRGGIFQVDVLTKGVNSSPYDFDTFCVQTQEFVTMNTTYRVLGITKNTYGINQNGIKLGSFAAWLYSGFLGVDGVTLGANFSKTDLLDVNALQVGIWQSMGYASPNTIPTISYDTVLLASWVTAFAADAAWAMQAADVNGNKTGNVSIMNLAKGYVKHGIFKVKDLKIQDQLVWIPPPPDGGAPVPEPLSLAVWSLLAMCVGGISTQRRRGRAAQQ